MDVLQTSSRCRVISGLVESRAIDVLPDLLDIHGHFFRFCLHGWLARVLPSFRKVLVARKGLDTKLQVPEKIDKTTNWIKIPLAIARNDFPDTPAQGN